MCITVFLKPRSTACAEFAAALLAQGAAGKSPCGNEDGRSVTKEDIQAFAQWLKTRSLDRDIAFRPARVLMQDFTGVPAVVDLAAMRDAMVTLGGDPKKINPLVPVDLVIDHSVIVNFAENSDGLKKNVAEEYAQNQERYQFLKWSGLRQLPKAGIPIDRPALHPRAAVDLLTLLAFQHPETFSRTLLDHSADHRAVVLPGTLLGVKPLSLAVGCELPPDHFPAAGSLGPRLAPQGCNRATPQVLSRLEL